MDLTQDVVVHKVIINNRNDCEQNIDSRCRKRLSDSVVTLRDDTNNIVAIYYIDDASSLDEIEIGMSDFTSWVQSLPYSGLMYQWKFNEGKIESALCEGMVMEIDSTESPSGSNIVLGTNSALGWNQQWTTKSTSAVLLPQSDSQSQEWKAVFVQGNYDYALLPGFSDALTMLSACSGVNNNGVTKVKIKLEGTNYLHLREVEVYDDKNVNVALNKTATQSSNMTGPDAAAVAGRAVDGSLTTISHTNSGPGKCHLSFSSSELR